MFCKLYKAFCFLIVRLGWVLGAARGIYRDGTWALRWERGVSATGPPGASQVLLLSGPGRCGKWPLGATLPGGGGASGCGGLPVHLPTAPRPSSWDGDLPSLQTQANSSAGHLGGPAEPCPGEEQRDGWKEGPPVPQPGVWVAHLAWSFHSFLSPARCPPFSPDAPLLFWGSGWLGCLLLVTGEPHPRPGSCYDHAGVFGGPWGQEALRPACDGPVAALGGGAHGRPE